VQSGNFYGNDDYEGSIGNSNYKALQVSVKHSSKRLTYSLGYTFSKSIDQASSLADVLDPYNFTLTRGLSAWNLTSDFVATYDYRLPLELLTHHARRLLEGWEISGVTRASTGFPITLSSNGDNSLQGSSPNGVNNPTWTCRTLRESLWRSIQIHATSCCISIPVLSPRMR